MIFKMVNDKPQQKSKKTSISREFGKDITNVEEINHLSQIDINNKKEEKVINPFNIDFNGQDGKKIFK